MGSEEGGAFDTPQMKAMMLSYPSQMVSWLGLQLRVTTFSIKVCGSKDEPRCGFQIISNSLLYLFPNFSDFKNFINFKIFILYTF